MQKYRSKRSIADFDARYLPENSYAFNLPCFWVHRKHFFLYGSDLTEGPWFSQRSVAAPDHHILLPLHPTDVDRYRPFLERAKAHDASRDGVKLWALPTSSVRTLLVWPSNHSEQAVFVKMSIGAYDSGFRNINRSMLAGTIGIATLVRATQHQLPGSVSWLFDAAGFIPRAMPQGGTYVRTIPAEVLDGRVRLAPAFSLVEGDHLHLPLILRVFNQSGDAMLRFVEEVLCGVFSKLWLTMSMEFGILLEAHGQNLMVTLSPENEFLPRFFYRDFEGISVDWELRRNKGLPAPDDLPHSWSWDTTYSLRSYPVELVYHKYKVSLFVYLRFFLKDLERRLITWRSGGVIDGPQIYDGLLTEMFSRKMRDALLEIYGATDGGDYNIDGNVNRFILFLMRLRRRLLPRVSG